MTAPHDGKARLAFDRLHEDLSHAPKGARKEPIDKADMPDINNAQAMLPYINDIHKHYRDSEVRLIPLIKPTLCGKALSRTVPFGCWATPET